MNLGHAYICAEPIELTVCRLLPVTALLLPLGCAAGRLTAVLVLLVDQNFDVIVETIDLNSLGQLGGRLDLQTFGDRS